jgi:predicted alpha/beta-fold hydrolase
VDPFRDPAVIGNPHVTVIVTRHGGHCGFIESRQSPHAGDGYWAERTVVAFAEQATGHCTKTSSAP